MVFWYVYKNWTSLFYGIATYLFITLTIFQEMLKFITLPNRTKPGLIDLKWQTPVKFFLLSITNLVISRTVLDNIPCWFLKEFAIYSGTIISQWPTVKCCLYLTWEIPTKCEFGFIHQIPTRDWCLSSYFYITYRHHKYGFYSLKPTQNNLIKAHHSFVFCVHWK